MKINRPRILVTEPEYFTKNSLHLMKTVGHVSSKRMSYGELLRCVHKYDALVVRIDTKVDRKLIERAKLLTCVVSATTGLNHIDTAFLKKKNIALFSLHGTHSISTAEHSLALLFSLARQIPFAHMRMVQGGWNRWDFMGTELFGKTMGIFGIGKIGREVAKRARAFGMSVITYDPYVTASIAKEIGVKKVNWNVFLKTADFFSVHAPLTSETKHIFGRSAFAQMKPTAIIINAGRGEIIDNNALLGALRKRSIAGAAIDVYSEEPLPNGHTLRTYARTHKNLILTPHLGASTMEAVGQASAVSAEAVVRFFKDKR